MSADEYVLDTPVVREFVAGVRATIAAPGSPAEACDAIRPRFAALLADAGWLPDALPGGRPGERDGRRHRPVAAVPRRRPLADAVRARRPLGLADADPRPPRVGARRPLPRHAGRGDLRARRRRRARARRGAALAPGDFYALLPPRDDIHRVRTTSPETSVSLHLLTNDTGCVWRHAFDEHTGEASPFRSGYVNVDCDAQRDPQRAGAREDVAVGREQRRRRVVLAALGGEVPAGRDHGLAHGRRSRAARPRAARAGSGAPSPTAAACSSGSPAPPTPCRARRRRRGSGPWRRGGRRRPVTPEWPRSGPKWMPRPSWRREPQT